VALATVNLLNTHPVIGSVTDSLGNFIISNVPVGRYDLEVSYTGYKPVRIRELLLSSAKETFVSVLIKQSITSLDTVVVKQKLSKESLSIPWQP
jgi:hypothetical protein